MHRWNSLLARMRDLLARMRDERGSATLEFLGLGVLLLVPISYGTLTLVGLEQATLASEIAARNSARVLAANAAANESLAQAHLHHAFTDHGIDPAEATIETRCHPNPNCLAETVTAGQSITVTVRIQVPLPGLPGGAGALGILVEASATYPQAGTGPQPVGATGQTAPAGTAPQASETRASEPQASETPAPEGP